MNRYLGGYRRILFVIVILSAALLQGVAPADGGRPLSTKSLSANVSLKYLGEGRVNAYGIMDNEMALQYLHEDYYAWFNQNFDAMQVYSPWFDEHTAWYDRGYQYKDMYAIYDCRLPRVPGPVLVDADSAESICSSINEELLELYQLAEQAEANSDLADWILKDTYGNRLYIPTTDHYGRLTQFAADIRNPLFRKAWISQMGEVLQSGLFYGGYKGIFVDDVNMSLVRSVTNSKCLLVAVPYTPGCDWTTDITPLEWSQNLVLFTQQIHAAFSDYEIIHNSPWYHALPGNPYLEEQVQAADLISLERGVNDMNIIGGNGYTSVKSFLVFNDYLHQQGTGVVHYLHLSGEDTFGPIAELRQLEYGLAGWLLISTGYDYIGASSYDTPINWWEGFNIDLGSALNERYQIADGVFRRDFERGTVLLNEPRTYAAEPPVLIDLQGLYKTLGGDCIDQITLTPRRGKILFAVDACLTIIDEISASE